jgi:hypothetical protein
MPKLIDTNVMLAASAIYNDLSALVEHASPPDVALREAVYDALRAFEESDELIVLDEEGLIRAEYERNMPFNQHMQSQEYGLLVLQKKLDYDQVNWVIVEVREGNGERLGIIADDLAQIVTDREDHKWIASASSHQVLYETVPPIVYGAESDWFVIEDALRQRGFLFERLLPDAWYQSRHQT